MNTLISTTIALWIRIALVLLGATLLMVSLSFYQRRYSPDPEWVRKLMHMGSGLLALSFPWLFVTAWPVLLLAITSALGMLAVRYCAALDTRVGGVVGRVGRRSLGEIYFPLGIALLFLLTVGQPLRYAMPLLLFQSTQRPGS